LVFLPVRNALLLVAVLLCLTEQIFRDGYDLASIDSSNCISRVSMISLR
jgi:hypothetical protein